MNTRPILLILVLALAACAPSLASPPEAPSTTPTPGVTASAVTAPVHEPAAVTAPTVDVGDPHAAPPGFPAQDEFEDIVTACTELVPRLVEREDLRNPIVDWCYARAYSSSRNGRVTSRLDGSWIHDRDRPSAYGFYRQGIRAGFLDPQICEHHVVDETIKRDRKAREFPNNWPYGTYCDRSQGECRPSNPGVMLADVAEAWHKHEPDYERFGTRGPIDLNLGLVVKYLGGCYPPEAIDRFDVSAAATIKRSEHLCLKLEDKLSTRAKKQAAKSAGLPTSCRSHRDLRVIWNPRFWYERLRQALHPAK